MVPVLPNDPQAAVMFIKEPIMEVSARPVFMQEFRTSRHLGLEFMLFFAFVLILQFCFHLLNFEFQVFEFQGDLRWPDIFQQLKFLNFPYI